MQDREDILDIINLTHDDLAKNQENQLSPAQIHFVKKKLFLLGIETLTLLLLSVILIILLIIFACVGFASHEGLILIFPIGLLWLWILRKSPIQWRQARQDIQTRRISKIEGQVQCEISGNIGLIQIPHYIIHIAELQFSVDKHIYYQFKNREYYKVFYTPQSKILLGGVQIRPITRGIEKERNTVQELIEPLTKQEQELLRQIVMGRSNKEIAVSLSLSPNTIKMYTSKLYRKLGARRRTEAISRARELELL